MKILYVDLYHDNWGSKRINKNIIQCLAKFSEVTVICPENWYDRLPDNVTEINFEPKSIWKQGTLHNLICTWKIMKYTRRVKKRDHYDYIFASTYHTCVYGIGQFMFHEDKVYLLHNNNVDKFIRPLDKYLFQTYCHKVHHIVLEEFIGEYLIKNYKLEQQKVFFLPHPLNKIKDYVDVEERIFDCVGISNSNDEELIQDIVSYEKRREVFKKCNLHVVLRSKNIEFDDGNLRVIKGYLENNIYDRYISNARVLYIPFPKTYRYRMSGTIIDAFSNHIKVLGTDIPIIRYYMDRYPQICQVVDNEHQFVDLILKFRESKDSEDKSEFREFQEIHSFDNIMQLLKTEFS